MTAAEAADRRQVPQGPKGGGASDLVQYLDADEKRRGGDCPSRGGRSCLDPAPSPLSQGQTLSLDEAAAAAFVQRRGYNERIARVYRLGTFSSNVQERIATRLMVQFIISRVDYSS